MQSNVVGHEAVGANMRKYGRDALPKVIKAVEVTTAQIVKAAQANHGSNAHAQTRYENRTTLLTNSMKSDPAKVVGARVIGKASANKEYASDVELGTSTSRAYPFMFPALQTEGSKLAKNLKITMS